MYKKRRHEESENVVHSAKKDMTSNYGNISEDVGKRNFLREEETLRT